MEEILKFHEKNLERVNYWLQFAEAKNAAMIAFTVSVQAFVQAINTPDTPPPIKFFCFLSILTYTGALLIAILSLYPRYDSEAGNTTGIY